MKSYQQIEEIVECGFEVCIVFKKDMYHVAAIKKGFPSIAYSNPNLQDAINDLRNEILSK